MGIRTPAITAFFVLSVTVIYFQTIQGNLSERSITAEASPIDNGHVDASGSFRIELAESTECNPRVTVCDEK